MIKHATEYYYQNKIEKLERKIEKLREKLLELNVSESEIDSDE